MKYITWPLLLLYSVCSYSSNSFADDLVNAANDRTTQNVRYDGAYHRSGRAKCTQLQQMVTLRSA